MKVESVAIEPYGWQVTFFFAVTTYHTASILETLDRIRCPQAIRERVCRNLQKGEMDTGFTYSNSRMRKSAVVVGLASTPAQFLNSFEHELRHLCDDIATSSRMQIRGEEVAYLTGDLNERLWKIVHEFICCKCRPRSHNR